MGVRGAKAEEEDISIWMDGRMKRCIKKGNFEDSDGGQKEETNVMREWMK